MRSTETNAVYTPSYLNSQYHVVAIVHSVAVQSVVMSVQPDTVLAVSVVPENRRGSLADHPLVFGKKAIDSDCR